MLIEQVLGEILSNRTYVHRVITLAQWYICTQLEMREVQFSARWEHYKITQQIATHSPM